MPKEITYSDDSPFLKAVDGNEYPEEGAAPADAKWRQRGVVVGWAKDKHVEIGAASFDPSRELPSDGVFMSLDRTGINRLIRSLRKARDAAFGSDA